MTNINNVKNLYKDRKISQFTTDVNLINGMTIGNANAREKGIKHCEKAVAKHEDKAPITERRRKKQSKQGKGRKLKKLQGKPVNNLCSKETHLVVYKQRQKTFSTAGRITMLSLCSFLFITFQVLKTISYTGWCSILSFDALYAWKG